ncbi:MAG: hypothetical protein K1W08_13065 [Lachnospiraceae bacterium]|jgi:hypothetical protein
MKDKLFFLQLEDSTVNLPDNIIPEELCGLVPDAWIKILSSEDKKERCHAVIGLWKKYLGKSLPTVIKRFEKELDNVELLERRDNNKRSYSLLYSMIDESGRCIYYEGRNPIDNIAERSRLSYWENMSQQIKDFYEHIHDGFYHYMNRGMGLQPLCFTHFMEPEDEVAEWNRKFGGDMRYGDEGENEVQEWNLDVGEYDELWEESSHQMAFFWNSLGLAVSMDDSKDSEKNAIIWKSATSPAFHNDFWGTVDQLLFYF